MHANFNCGVGATLIAAFSHQECHYLNIQEETVTSYRLPSGFIYMLGTRASIEMVRTCNISKENAPGKASQKFP